MNYGDYMESQEWRDLRDECKENAGGKCEFCGQQAYTAHHVEYPKDFKDDCIIYLVSICDKCHKLCHGIKPLSLKFLSEGEIEQLNKCWFTEVRNQPHMKPAQLIASNKEEPLAIISFAEVDRDYVVKNQERTEAILNKVLTTRKHEKITTELCLLIWKLSG